MTALPGSRQLRALPLGGHSRGASSVGGQSIPAHRMELCDMRRNVLPPLFEPARPDRILRDAQSQRDAQKQTDLVAVNALLLSSILSSLFTAMLRDLYEGGVLNRHDIERIMAGAAEMLGRQVPATDAVHAAILDELRIIQRQILE